MLELIFVIFTTICNFYMFIFGSHFSVHIHVLVQIQLDVDIKTFFFHMNSILPLSSSLFLKHINISWNLIIVLRLRHLWSNPCLFHFSNNILWNIILILILYLPLVINIILKMHQLLLLFIHLFLHFLSFNFQGRFLLWLLI